jgi:SMI1 / KNR4
MNITWKRGSKIDESTIKKVETKFGITLPGDYKRIIINHNNARPSVSTFDTESSTEHVFKKLLSLKEDDLETVYKAKKVLSTIDDTLFPFANDPAGNYLCFKNGAVVYWLHEDNSVLKVANSFTEFIAKLY